MRRRAAYLLERHFQQDVIITFICAKFMKSVAFLDWKHSWCFVLQMKTTDPWPSKKFSNTKTLLKRLNNFCTFCTLFKINIMLTDTLCLIQYVFSCVKIKSCLYDNYFGFETGRCIKYIYMAILWVFVINLVSFLWCILEKLCNHFNKTLHCYCSIKFYLKLFERRCEKWSIL